MRNNPVGTDKQKSKCSCPKPFLCFRERHQQGCRGILGKIHSFVTPLVQSNITEYQQLSGVSKCWGTKDKQERQGPNSYNIYILIGEIEVINNKQINYDHFR